MLNASQLLGKHEYTPPPVIKQTKAMKQAPKLKEAFIKKANVVHSNKYDYSLVEYVRSNKPVSIICPDHGMFRQLPGNHLHGSECIICSAYKKREITNAK